MNPLPDNLDHIEPRLMQYGAAGIGLAHAWLLEYDAEVDVRQRKPPDSDAFKLAMRVRWRHENQEHGVEIVVDGILTLNDCLWEIVGSVITRFPLPPPPRDT